MADRVRKTPYYYATIDNKPGEGARVLKAFRDAGVNLLAFHAFPSEGKAQLDFFPADADKFVEAAKNAKIAVSGRKTAFLLEGDDRVGAVHDVLDKLGKAGINVTAVDAVATGGRYGALLWVKATDVDKAAGALGA